MFIVIYKEGTQHDVPLTKQTYALAEALPGEKYIFEWGNAGGYVYALNVPGGVWFNKADSDAPFKHGDYQLTNIHHRQKRSTEFVFRHKGTEDIVIRIDPSVSMSKALTDVVREIILASKFNSWGEYQSHNAASLELRSLREENALLKKELEELKQKLENQN